MPTSGYPGLNAGCRILPQHFKPSHPPSSLVQDPNAYGLINSMTRILSGILSRPTALLNSSKECLEIMMDPSGFPFVLNFEPKAYALQRRRSTVELRAHMNINGRNLLPQTPKKN